MSAQVSGSNESVVWASSDKSIVSISESGKITAHKAGIAYISGQCGGAFVQCKIVVKKAKLEVKLKKKSLGKATLKLKVGKNYKLKTTVTPYGKVSYKVKNKNILKVNKKGTITTLEKGTTTITVSVNGMKKKIKVKVK